VRITAALSLVRYVNPLRLVGAIFDKELRVAGRRRRNYVLRFLYVSVFAAFVILVWLASVPAMSAGIVQASRMSQAGMSMIMVIVWFQFIASQFIAVVMLSTAISDEIYHKTLGLLMTTPINSLQIVLGKLASRLLQIVLLLGLSLPLLAIIRIFGGIPWSFLLCTFSVTLTTVVFCGSLSLFHSIFSRRAYTVIIETIIVAMILFGLLPLGILLGFQDAVPQYQLLSLLTLINPYVLMAEISDRLAQPGAVAALKWPHHCAISLGASALLILLSTILVRKAALRQAVGQEGSWLTRRPSRQAGGTSGARVRRIVGPPVLWREFRVPLLARTMSMKFVVVAVGAGGFLLTYALCARDQILGDKGTHIAFAVVLAFVGLLASVVLPATCITAEKESRAWPILLTTPIGRWGILSGKALGTLRRCFLVWLLLLAHVTIFVVGGIIHPVAILQLAIVVVGTTLFLCGAGLYFSSRFRRTTAAVVANMILAAGLWLVVPVFTMLGADILHWNERRVWLCVDTNPVFQVGVVVGATVHRGMFAHGGQHDVGGYEWCRRGTQNINEATLWLLLSCGIYTGIGLIFAAMAWVRLRKDPCG
jgi:ABC-type transport system involved in multi-copper enzyme maturation permease subunit